MFKRYLYRNYCSFAAINHRFGRRVTPLGWLLMATTIVSAALGADTNLSMAYQGFAFLGCLLVASALGTGFNRPRVEIERTLPRFGLAGEPLRYRIRIWNRSRRAQNSLTVG